MNLRSATPADLDLLRHWDEQPHVTASDPNDDWGWEVELERNPEWREQLIAEIDGRPIGFIQIIDPLASNTRAHRFYERLGFQFVERRQFGDDDCFVYRINRVEK
jgi:aminoglycoside 6'-N-acetyltransferase